MRPQQPATRPSSQPPALARRLPRFPYETMQSDTVLKSVVGGAVGESSYGALEPRRRLTCTSAKSVGVHGYFNQGERDTVFPCLVP